MRRPNNYFTDWDLTDEPNAIGQYAINGRDSSRPNHARSVRQSHCPSLLNVNRPFYLEQINLVVVDRKQTNNSHSM